MEHIVVIVLPDWARDNARRPMESHYIEQLFRPCLSKQASISPAYYSTEYSNT